MITNIQCLPPVPEGFSEPIKGKLDHPSRHLTSAIIRYSPPHGRWDAIGWRGEEEAGIYSLHLDSAVYEMNKAMFTPKGNPHAALMLEYAKDWAETRTPWERWQSAGHNGSLWQSLYGHPNWLDDFQYRRIPTPPPTILINGIKVPEPVREWLKDYGNYYTFSCDGTYSQSWLSGEKYPSHLKRLKAGIIHLTREAAEIHRKALLSFTALPED